MPLRNGVQYLKAVQGPAVPPPRARGLQCLARGFRTFANYRAAILFHCRDLDMLPALNQPLHTIPR